MTPLPLSKAIYDKAKSLGIEEIVLNFSGGNDEGYLTVGLSPYPKDDDFEGKVEAWAWDNYSYSGAGDGSDFGDDITYNLKDGTVHASEWYSKAVHNPIGTSELKINED